MAAVVRGPWKKADDYGGVWIKHGRRYVKHSRSISACDAGYLCVECRQFITKEQVMISQQDIDHWVHEDIAECAVSPDGYDASVRINGGSRA